MLTPEREKEIRDMYRDHGYAYRPTGETVAELLSEIDTLRAENEKLRDGIIEPYDSWKSQVLREDSLREKLEVAVKSLKLGLDFYHMNTKEWVEKHGNGMTTKDLGNNFREALENINGKI